MSSITYLLAPLALLFSTAKAEVSPGHDRAAIEGLESQWAASTIPVGPPLIEDMHIRGAFSGFTTEGLADDGWNQVRIEQRMIVRIAPRMPGQLFVLPSRPPQQPRFFERKTPKCLPITSIAGVQPESAGRLLLITRSHKLIGASLDKSCRARDFYSGFYVEQNADGQLCAGRDIIHSRAGANCAVTKLRELVPDED